MMWLWQWQCEPGYEYINNISDDNNNNNNDIGSCNNEKNHYLVKRVFFSIENQIHKFFLVGFENKDRSILKLNLKLFKLYFWSNIFFQKIYLFKNNKNLRSP